MEYGNKQPVRCKWDDPDIAEYMRNQTTLYDYDAISLPSFRGCPHVKRIEHWKFVKFEVSIAGRERLIFKSSCLRISLLGYKLGCGSILGFSSYLAAKEAYTRAIPAVGSANRRICMISNATNIRI